MSIETELRTKLLADSTISGLIGTRVYPIVAPQNPIYPFIVYQRISGERYYHLTAAAGRAHPRIRFDVYSNTYLGMKAVADAVRQDLSKFIGTLTTIKASIHLETEMEFYEVEDGLHIYRMMQDYFVNHTEA